MPPYPTRGEMDGIISRKRSKESVSSNHSEVPEAKKKKLEKLSTKGKETVLPSKHSSVLPTPSPSPPLPSSLETAPRSSEVTASLNSRPAVLAVAGGSLPTRKKISQKLPKNPYLRPQKLSSGSWMTHIASLVVHRSVQSAVSCGLDPRGHLSEINWSQMLEGLLRPEDLHRMWYFIRREYSDKTLESILESTQPYSELSMESLLREEIRVKYKNEMPKVPQTAYFIFAQSKMAKLKKKHPNLPVTEVATKLGKKWNATPEEKKDKYRQQHAAMKVTYEAQLQSFYEEHPDARPPPKQPKSKKVTRTTAKPEERTEEEKVLKELEAQCPKKPLSAYLHFCKKKREKLHRKYPELAPQAVTTKLGKRWKSMDAEARTKYIKLHDVEVQQFKDNLARFYSDHPEAEELLANARKMKRKKKATSKQSSVVVAPKTVETSTQQLEPRVDSQPLLQPHTHPLPASLPSSSSPATAAATVEEADEADEEEDSETAEVAPGPVLVENGRGGEEDSSDDGSSDSDSDNSSSDED